MKPQSASSFLVILLLVVVGCGGGDGSGSDAAVGADDPGVHMVTAAMLESGHATYVENCVPCHGAGGRGDGPSSANLDPKPRDHTDRAYMSTLSDEKLAATIRNGGVMQGMPQMPSHPHIQGEDMDALVAFVRSLSESPPEQASVD